jgi:hypothetical protein
MYRALCDAGKIWREAMKVDMPGFDLMKDVRSQVKDQLSTKGTNSPEFRLHPSLTFGINEVTRGLARLFPHRRSIAYIQGCGPYFDPLVTFFSAEGYSLQALPFTHLQQSDWIETLKKDTLLVLFSEDDPLTGQIFEIEKFQTALELKRIFTVSVSHSAHLYRPRWNVAPYWARILSGGSKYCLSLLGDRASKLENLLFGPPDWIQIATNSFSDTLELREEAQNAVESFEALCPAGGKPFFTRGTARLFDRAAIYWEDMDGEAFIHGLAQVLKIPLNVPGIENRLETASLCRWKGLRSMQWLTEQGVSAEISRGLVLISKDLIYKNLPAEMQKVRDHILRLQNG